MDLETTPLSELSTKQLQFLKRHKLDDDQIQIALAIDKESRRQGINPEFVWPMVLQESRFRQDAKSDKGAVGVMQLMDDTANGLRVDSSDLQQNIYGGISLLKELMQNPKIGNDPNKVLAGYNSSTETRNKFYASGDYNDLKTETLLHMKKVADHYDEDKSVPLPTVNYEPPKEDAVPPAPPMPPASTASGTGTVQPLTNNVPLPVQQIVAGAAPVIAATHAVSPYVVKYLGAEQAIEGALENSGLGKTGATTVDASGKVVPAQTHVEDAAPSSPYTPPKTEPVKPSGRANETAHNVNSALLAANKRTQYDALIKAGLRPDQAFAQLAGKIGAVGSTDAGIVVPEAEASAIREANARKNERALQVAKSAGAQYQSIEAAKLAAKIGTPQEKAEALSWLGKAMGKVKSFTGNIPNVVKNVPQALFTAGATVPLAWNEYKEGNPKAAAAIAATGAGLSGLALKMPKTSGAISAGLSGLYSITHPQEAAAAMRMSDVVDPTVSMFMTGSEMYEPAIPELQQQQRRAGAGRGFVNLPHAGQ
jgi:hypothetical protein